MISPETLEKLKLEIDKKCFKNASDDENEEKSFFEKTWSDIRADLLDSALDIVGMDSQNIEYFNDCSSNIIRAELEASLSDEDQSGNGIKRAFHDNLKRNSAAQIYEPSSQDFEDFSKKIAFLIIEKIEKDKLKSIVDEGVTTVNYKNPTIGSFIHNLCQFWFDKYFSEYLTSQQMISRLYKLCSKI